MTVDDLSPGVWPIVRTWVATFLGFLAVAQWVLDLSATRGLLYSAVGAAGAAVLAAIKAELATYVGDQSSTALLSARFDTTAVERIQ